MSSVKRDHYADQKMDVDEVIKSHTNLVKKIAWHIYGRASHAIEIEDIIQIGFAALINAAQQYTLKEGATFATYASIRIKGDIIDHLRKASNLCRTTITMKKRYNKVVSDLRGKLFHEPTSVEISNAMGISEPEFREWERAFQANSHESLDSVYDQYSIWFASADDSPEDLLNSKDLKEVLKLALQELSGNEALVIQLYYVEELNVMEIAEVLDVSSGRVSQIKKAAIANLRDNMKNLQAI
ncbi:FliA/WhiG family RNA polymerase sigma factor [Candidatus Puniceispirillum sp.]|nr:FliA/WhiG family RNA polymerase sigma factor [Candidatus Puniceispirillum sp.]